MEIKFIEANGAAHVVEVAPGVSLMRAALDNGVPGIDGDCGGNAACGTCHIFIDPLSREAVKTPPGEHETSMLEILEGVQENSRLACQITLQENMDGMIVHLPAAQF
jgi:2Fe-2S ferredoxin